MYVMPLFDIEIDIEISCVIHLFASHIQDGENAVIATKGTLKSTSLNKSLYNIFADILIRQP
jgi:hypothetical protein